MNYCMLRISFLLMVAGCYDPLTALAQTKPIQPNPDTLTTDKILSSLYDISQLPQYLDHTVCAQVSSYDITGGNDDGFSGKNSFIRRNADSSLVLFDIKGCGLINRIWTPTPTADTLDFYLDGSPKPTLSIQYTDLFSGKAYPFIAPLCGNDLGGFYCYFPIVFNKGCMIVCRGKKMQFHQIQYRLYPAGTVAASFSPVQTSTTKNELETIGGLWGREEKTMAGYLPVKNAFAVKKISKQVELKPGGSVIIFSAATGGRINGITCSPASAFEGLDKLVDIEITWDDDKTPAVNCPLADFFGYAFGKTAMQALLLGSQRNTNYCFIPMPFDKKAAVRLRYRSRPAGEPAPAPYRCRQPYIIPMPRACPKKKAGYTLPGTGLRPWDSRMCFCRPKGVAIISVRFYRPRALTRA